MPTVGKHARPIQGRELGVPGPLRPGGLVVVALGAATLGLASLAVGGCSSSPASAGRAGRPAAATLAAGRGAPPSSPAGAPATSTTRLPALAVAKVSPADRAQGVGPSTPVVVTYNRSPGPAVPTPTISPPAPGHWQRTGPAQLTFTPTGYWQPGTTYRVSVPLPGRHRVVRFTTGLPSLLALQQYLAILGYLPLRFTPTGQIPNRKAVLAHEPTEPYLVPWAPSPGVFTWAYPGVPELL